MDGSVSLNGFEIIHEEKIDANVHFFRINPTDIRVTLKWVFQSLSSKSWISKFDEEYIRDSFEVRSNATIEYLQQNILTGKEDSITSESGEYVVSELARTTIVSKLGHHDIPLAELFKIKDVGNHGFDFYTVSPNKCILFGEAKYVGAKNGYGKALGQIARFVNEEKRDVADLLEIDKFCCATSKNNFSKGIKGFAAAFSSKSTETPALIRNLKGNKDYIELKKFSELICVAVNL